MDPYADFLRKLFRLAGELYFQRVEAELWKFAEPFYAWLYDLFQHPAPDWRESLGAFLANQAAEGRTPTPESRQSILDYLKWWAATIGLEDASPETAHKLEATKLAGEVFGPLAGLLEEEIRSRTSVTSPPLVPELPEKGGPGILDELLDPTLEPLVPSAAEYRKAQIEAHGDADWAMFFLTLNQAINRYLFQIEDRHEELESPGERTANDAADFLHGLAELSLAAAGMGPAKGTPPKPFPRAILTEGFEPHPGRMRQLLAEADDELRNALAPAIEEEMGVHLTGSRGVWEHGWGRRGELISERLGENLPKGFQTIDRFEKGTATSIKSLDLWSETYIAPQAVFGAGKRYIDKVANYFGGDLLDVEITAEMVRRRGLDLAVPEGATASQQQALKALISYGQQSDVTVTIVEIAK